jgi:hypothetical protein
MTTPPRTASQFALFMRTFISENDIGSPTAPTEGFARTGIQNGPERLYMMYDFQNKRFWFVFTTPGMLRRLYTTTKNPFAVIEHLYDDAGFGTGVDLDDMSRLPAVEMDDDWDDIPIKLKEMIEMGY